MKRLLIVTAVIELGAGLALVGLPSAAVALLLGSPLDAPAAVTLGRLAGAALFALGVACWLAHYDARELHRGGIGQRDGAVQPRRSRHPRCGRHPIAAGRHRLVAGGWASHGDDRLVRHTAFEEAVTCYGESKVISMKSDWKRTFVFQNK